MIQKIDLIAGARPNFMKIAPIIDALKGTSMDFRLVHTGQHYDRNMSGSFFDQLGIPEPHVNLGGGGGTQAEQTARIMVGYEALLLKERTDLCLVVGDVTSTLACSIAAKKLDIPVAHVEAGIRSGDRSMPEEINRMVTDSISDYFFTTTEWAGDQLRRTGVAEEQIFFVGNTMIDTLLKHRPKFIQPACWQACRLEQGNYMVMTLHRPANVDGEAQFKALLDKIIEESGDLNIVFPVHPRTRKTLEQLGVANDRLHLLDPLSYLEFNYLVERARVVVTDSGGITEETTVMGVPCITLRDNTERPETVELGTNELIGTDPEAIAPAMRRLFSGAWKKGAIPPLWDGKTAQRIAAHIRQL
ncbi:MAG: UDP-2,3-diacetamido-2,3-dideoxy-D-glucuronate 2-epimerase [Flavobacteriia bacterium]|nr:MAG: UDP-2,3-diacetamido-2,3-dideoxy-D-glucuronate 2-epimerase [Flavobacteriia bacterium]